jgi:hypothetical protein
MYRQLVDQDYPKNYVNCQHPEDLVVQPQYIFLEYIVHSAVHHSRLLLRISFLVDGGFLPMTFVLDTGMPEAMYLSAPAREALFRGGRLMTDRDFETQYIETTIDYEKRKIPITDSTSNIIGLSLLLRLKLQLRPYRLDNLPQFF